MTIASPNTRAKELASSARKLLEDLKALEVGMLMDQHEQRCTKKSTSPRLGGGRSLPCSQSSHHHQIPVFSNQEPRLKSSAAKGFEESIDGKHPVTGAFVAFCDRLLYMNRVWKEKQQVRALKASIRALEKERTLSAFQSFCDRLLVSNEIWQLERRIRDLVAEGERDRRARVAAIAHAAKQMAVDVRKEAMIEEFVVELVQELEESRRAVVEMKDVHEKEVREIHGDWLKEYRRLVGENERLRLDHHSRVVEQEVANELEQSLADALGWSRRRIRELEGGDLDETLVGDASERESVVFSGSEFSADGTLRDELEDIDDGVSTMSSCTYVSSLEAWSGKSSGCSKLGKSAASPKGSYRAEALRRQSLRKGDGTPYAGFSFNPLFFGGGGEARVVSPVESVEAPVKVLLKDVPLAKTSIRERKESVTVARTSRSIGPTGTRARWRI
jgi:hypothetical protein